MTTKAKGPVLRDRLPGEAGDERPLVRPQDRASRYIVNVGVALGHQPSSYEFASQQKAAAFTLSKRAQNIEAWMWDRETHVRYDDVALLQASGTACLRCGGHGWIFELPEDADTNFKSPCSECKGSGRRA